MRKASGDPGLTVVNIASANEKNKEGKMNLSTDSEFFVSIWNFLRVL